MTKEKGKEKKEERKMGYLGCIFLFSLLILHFSFVTACNNKKESGDVKLLERMISDNGTLVTFEYDTENRLVKTSHYINGILEFSRLITYEKDSVIVKDEQPYVGKEFANGGQTIYVIDRDTITYYYGAAYVTMTVNADGYVLTEKIVWDRVDHYKTTVYEYDNGNMISKKETYFVDGEMVREVDTSFRYDNKPSPFYSDNTPKWLLQDFFQDINFNNNVILLNDDIGTYEYGYEFGPDGFPIKKIEILHDGGVTTYYTTRFIYRGEIYEDENVTMADTIIPENVTALILKHFEAIENGDLAAFRSTLIPPEDGKDINAQLDLIYKYFGDFFDVDEAAFKEAVTDGGGVLEKIEDKAFSGVFPLRGRNTGLFIKEMTKEPEHNLISVVVSNNKNEETTYHLTFDDSETYEGIPFVGIGRHFELKRGF
jgi:hypothetical protein